MVSAYDIMAWKKEHELWRDILDAGPISVTPLNL
jgi:hypothetical protein